MARDGKPMVTCKRGHDMATHSKSRPQMVNGKPGIFRWCETCRRWRKEQYRKDPRNKDRFRLYNRRARLRSAYGITIEQYDELWEKQGGMCAICGGKTSSGRGFHVDHNHSTGVVRGILCHLCNLALGHFREDANLMRRAIKYLDK